jgi:hypothetical protein
VLRREPVLSRDREEAAPLKSALLIKDFKQLQSLQFGCLFKRAPAMIFPNRSYQHAEAIGNL